MQKPSMSEKIESILEQRRRQQEEVAETAADEFKFFQTIRGEGNKEEFFEIRFRHGVRMALSYGDLHWFNYIPEEGKIDLEFMGTVVTIEGRGLVDDLFQAIKSKKLSWVREADTEMQDNPANELFIKDISITSPPEFDEDEE